MTERRAGVVTVSNSAAAGATDDRSGTILAEGLADLGFDVVERSVIPDGVESVETTLRDLASRCDLIVTTGGTGLSPTDLTPEGTLRVVDRLVPGVSEALRADTFGKVPFGMLSRGVSGLAGACLVINLPGSPKAVSEGLEVIAGVLEHAIDLATGEFGRHD
ncbi:MAG: MogA/MoaB family molybdenum cofactor biosynthesis protein [Acidimicrobiia bacterium]